MSTPKSKGLRRYGVKNVLSKIKIIPCFLATADTALRSITFKVGFVGVSPNII